MNRLVAATFIGLTLAATLSTSASAFKCLAHGTNGVSAWGYGVFNERAVRFALRHCRQAGGVDCRVRYCR